MTARFNVRVIPNARKTEFQGRRENEWVLRLNAPALEGKANKAAVDYIARFLGIPRSSVSLVSGEKSRHKIFEIIGLEFDAIERKLTAADRSSLSSA